MSTPSRASEVQLTAGQLLGEGLRGGDVRERDLDPGAVPAELGERLGEQM
jgi:hypothetical protein